MSSSLCMRILPMRIERQQSLRPCSIASPATVIKICFYIDPYPVRWTAKSALHVTRWQTCSFWHQLDFSWKHYSHAAITRNDYSLTFPPLPIARYSFIQLCELERHGENGNVQTSKRYQRGIRTRAPLIASPAFYR